MSNSIETLAFCSMLFVSRLFVLGYALRALFSASRRAHSRNRNRYQNNRPRVHGGFMGVR